MILDETSIVIVSQFLFLLVKLISVISKLLPFIIDIIKLLVIVFLVLRLVILLGLDCINLFLECLNFLLDWLKTNACLFLISILLSNKGVQFVLFLDVGNGIFEELDLLDDLLLKIFATAAGVELLLLILNTLGNKLFRVVGLIYLLHKEFSFGD